MNIAAPLPASGEAIRENTRCDGDQTLALLTEINIMPKGGTYIQRCKFL